MLKGISPLVSPELLKALAEMGHGDEIVLADAHFPAHSLGVPVIRLDGVDIVALLGAILPLMELDSYVDAPVLMMSPVPGDSLDPHYVSACAGQLAKHSDVCAAPDYIDRFQFYDRARSAYRIVLTGETRKYGNILLKKGVTPVA